MGVLTGVINGGASGGSVDFSTTVILAPTSSSRNVIQATTTGVVPLVTKLATGSTSNLFECQNASGTILTRIGYDGSIILNTSAYIGGPTWAWQFSINSGWCQGYFNFGKYKFNNTFVVSQPMNWSSDAFNVAADVGIERTAAGILKFTNSSTGNGSIIVGAYSASTVALTVKAAASQTANIQEWQNSSGTVGIAVKADTKTITSALTELVLEQTGDALGTTRLKLRNRTGSAGAFFENVGLDLVDLGFVANSSYQCNIRFEHRSGSVMLSDNIAQGELQFLSNSGYLWFASGIDGTLFRNFTASSVPLKIRGATSQSGNLQEWQDSSATALSRVDKNGTLVTKVNAAPADGDLAANECSWYFDSTNGAAKVKFKGKSANGTVVSGEVALS